ncbi:MAG: CHAT domain-containing protein [Acidocella sp.]|nr:CHAT domain-containing protein [Acidocella sp.]
MNRTSKWLGIAVVLLAASLSGCTNPPKSAYDSSLNANATAGGAPIGQNTAGERCTSQPDGAGLDVYCGSWDQPSAQVRDGGMAPADNITLLATASPWRAGLEASYSCGAPQPEMILDGVPAIILTCTQRIGGWPHVALVSVINGKVYYGDGVAPALPPLERAMGVLSGKIAPSQASNATVASADAALVQRLAAQAYSSGDIGHYDSLMQLGSQANQAEDFSSAVIAYRAALALQQEKIGASNPATVEPMLELALNLSDQAQFPEAASLFDTAAKLAPLSADPNAPAKLLHYEGLDQLNQNHYEAAVKLLKAAYAAYTALLPPELLQAQPAQNNVTAMFAVNHSQGASVDLAEQTRLNGPVTQTALLGAIESLRYEAIADHALGKDQESGQAVMLSEQIANANDLDPELLGARLDRTNANLAANSGKTGSAITLLAAASDNFSAALPGSFPVAETDLLQGGAQHAQGDQITALQSCRNGVALLKTLQRGSSAALIGPCLDVFADAAKVDPANAQTLHGEMFEAAELAQGSVTAREIGEAAARLSSSSSNPRVAAAIRAQQDDQAKLASLYEERDRFVKAPGAAASATPGETLADIDKQIAAANRNLQADNQAVQAAAPNFGQLVQQVVSAQDVLKALRPDEGFLGITATPSRTWLFLMQNGKIQVASSDISDAGMTQLVKSVLNSIEPAPSGLPPYDMADASKIYQLTLAPFGADMAQVHELVIAPSGALMALPFALLPTGPASPDNLAGAPWLVRETNLSYVPAASNFVSLRKIEGTSAAKNPWFGFGDFQPVTLSQAQATYNTASCGDSAAEFAGLPHLPYATLELKAGAAIFGASPADELLGSDFTVPKVEAADLKDFQILHFATHALLPTDLPCQNQPAIVTSAPANAHSADQALLNTGDVTNLHLDANLVILSACNTGGGAEGGEALSGLARSFFYAGARAMMVTQWSVNDQVSAYLVADTLNRLHSGADGGVAGSLRAAQLALIDNAGHGMAANIADPFFWAAFAVIGDGGAIGNSKLSALSDSPKPGL